MTTWGQVGGRQPNNHPNYQVKRPSELLPAPIGSQVANWTLQVGRAEQGLTNSDVTPRCENPCMWRASRAAYSRTFLGPYNTLHATGHIMESLPFWNHSKQRQLHSYRNYHV
jgi:hypothetical protein